MTEDSPKAQLQAIAGDLRDDATWEEILQVLRENAAIARGVADIDAGRVVTLDTVRAKYGLVPGPRTRRGMGAIERGLADSEAGRVHRFEDVMREMAIDP